MPGDTSGALGNLVATDDGLSMNVTLDRAEIAPGGAVQITVVIKNSRPTPVDLSIDCGSPAVVEGAVDLPLNPEGQLWTGTAAAFKKFALANGLGPGGVPATAPVQVAATGLCPQDQLDTTLSPGASMTTSRSWTADIVDGVPALPGTVQLQVSVGHDPSGGPPPGWTFDPNEPAQSWVVAYKQLTVEAPVQVSGDGLPTLITAGEALDSILADERFETLLSSEPVSSWSNVNLFLAPNDGTHGGIAPLGPSWEIDVLREVNGAGRGAIGFVDPFSGKLENLTFE